VMRPKCEQVIDWERLIIVCSEKEKRIRVKLAFKEFVSSILINEAR